MIVIYVLLAGATSAATGLALQIIGNMTFSHFGGNDSKELAGLAGMRVSAIFAIAVGLIFSGSHTHYIEAKKDLLEEARLIGTMSEILADAPDFPASRRIQAGLLHYARILAIELDQPELADRSAAATSRSLLEICKLAAPDLEKGAAMSWLRTQLESSCGKLIELRGTKRVWMLTDGVETSFWIFFCISFGSLAFLLGVFEKRLLNLVFAALFYFSAGATAILIHWMGDPYHGPNRISSAPLTLLIDKVEMLGKMK